MFLCRINPNQLADLFSSNLRTNYLHQRATYNELMIARHMGTGAQTSIDSCHSSSIPPPQEYPDYDTIHPNHLHNQFPTYGGYRVTGAYFRKLIMVGLC